MLSPPLTVQISYSPWPWCGDLHPGIGSTQQQFRYVTVLAALWVPYDFEGALEE